MSDHYFGTDADDSIDQRTLKLPNYSRIFPGAGNDNITVTYAFVQGDAGHDLITDLTGSSIVDYSASPTGIVVDLQTGRVHDGYGTIDQLVNVHEVQGSKFDDRMIGSDDADRFSPNGGADHVDGGNGKDEVIFFYAINNYSIHYKDGLLTVLNKDPNASDAGLKTLRNIESLKFDGAVVPVRELFPEIGNSPLFQFQRNAIPDLSSLYRWDGWNTASVAVNFVLTPDLNHDGKSDIVAQLWQRVPEGGMVTELPTPNRLIVMESQADGTYMDTTASRFKTSSAVVLGGELGGVGLADSADINQDGLADFIFALNRDDGRAGIQDSGNSYSTAIVSRPDGSYDIQQISTPDWNYFTQWVNVDGKYQAWVARLNSNSTSVIYGTYPEAWVESVPVYQYDTQAQKWVVAGQPPISTSFNVLPEFVKDGKVNRVFTVLNDSSKAIDPDANVPGGAHRVPYAALMDLDANGLWQVNSISNPFAYAPTPFSMNGQAMTGQVGFDGEGYFSLIEYFYRPGSFEIFPNSGQVVMATRTMLPLVKDIATGQFTADGRDTVKLDFYGIRQDQIYKVPIKIVGFQENVYSWSYVYLDINHDGLTDLVQQGWNHVDQTGGGPNVYLNTGAGVFVHLDPSLFPQAPDYWNKPAMSQFLDANGDGLYDLLYFPAYAEAQHIPDTTWKLYQASAPLQGNAYTHDIQITDRLQSPVIKTWAGNDTVAGLNIHPGLNQIDLGEGFDTVQYTGASSDYTLQVDAQQIWCVKGAAFDDALSNVEQLQFGNKTVFIASQTHQSYADLPDSLYQFFVTAFGAAPGVTYMDQLAEAYRHGLSVQQIVEIFTTKTQFTDMYSPSLTRGQLAQALVDNIVKNSASDAAKQAAVKDIIEAMELAHWTVGQVIYQVFGNLAHFAFSDTTWGNTARQFTNEVAVAKYYTDVLNQSTTDLETLRDVIQAVKPDTDVSTDAALAQLVGVALLTGGAG